MLFWEQMESSGPGSEECEHTAPRTWGGFTTSARFVTKKSFRPTVCCLLDGKHTVFLAAWTCVAPPQAIGHAFLLEQGGWVRFTSRTYHTLPSGLSDVEVWVSSRFHTTPRLEHPPSSKTRILRVYRFFFIAQAGRQSRPALNAN